MASTTDKIKSALGVDKHSTSTTHGNNVPEGTAGPHNSRVANAADPRIDSDLDGSNRHGTTHAGTHAGTHIGTHTGTHTGASGYGAGVTGHSTTGHSTTGAGYGSSTGPAPGTAGPHSSNIGNKLDPTVDSNLDGGRHLGAKSDTRTAGYSATGNGATGHSTSGAGYSSTGAHTGAHNGHSTTGAGYGSTGTHIGEHSTTGAGYGNGSTTTAGLGHSHGGITGASGSHATPGSGTAQNTAGPHNSDLLNKLDPRVDSDLSGGKTYGGNKTHS